MNWMAFKGFQQQRANTYVAWDSSTETLYPLEAIRTLYTLTLMFFLDEIETYSLFEAKKLLAN